MLHYEDFSAGQVFELGPYPVEREAVFAFAREFDPQAFHLDEEFANNSVLKGLSSSGWHTCAMLMRMMCDAYLCKSAGMGSTGVDEVRWLKPVYVGETLSGRTTVISKRVSAKRPEMGIVICRWELFNQRGEKKIEQTGVNFIRVRKP